MSYSLLAFTSVAIFAWVHLIAQRTQQLGTILHGRFLSFGGGVAIAYIFVDLLPKLGENDVTFHELFVGFFPFIERHVYVMALVGFLLFFAVDRAHGRTQRRFWLTLAPYTLFNFFVGYAVTDQNDPEVQPLALFTLAIALHYFVNDYTLNEAHGSLYRTKGKWVLIASLFLGWLVGLVFTLPAAGVALMSAFIGGGVIMNVTRHELPKDKPHSLGAFLLSAAIYSAILLAIGQ